MILVQDGTRAINYLHTLTDTEATVNLTGFSQVLMNDRIILVPSQLYQYTNFKKSNDRLTFR